MMVTLLMATVTPMTLMTKMVTARGLLDVCLLAECGACLAVLL